MQIVGDNRSWNQTVNRDENEDGAISNERIGEKRMRQPYLIEKLGKFQRLFKLQEVLRDIKDPTHVDYLKKIQAAVAEIQKAEADVRAYREGK